MNKTSNYQLCQWDGEDRILRTDFNEDNAKIDAALKSHANSIATINSTLSGKASTSTVNSLTNTVNQKANQSALTAEVNARTAADTAESSARIQADSTEKAAREAADTAEAQARAQAVAALTAGLALKGNCQIYYTSYVGDGELTKTLTFPGRPLLVVIMGDNRIFHGVYGNVNVICRSAGTDGDASDAVWTENSLTWTMVEPYYSCNYSGSTYHVVALMAMDE